MMVATLINHGSYHIHARDTLNEYIQIRNAVTFISGVALSGSLKSRIITDLSA